MAVQGASQYFHMSPQDFLFDYIDPVFMRNTNLAAGYLVNVQRRAHTQCGCLRGMPLLAVGKFLNS